MFAIIGIVVVIVSILGGYLIESGPLHVLWQPAELIIILGAAAGILIVGNPPKVLKTISSSLPRVFSGGGIDKLTYQDALAALYELFMVGKKNGLLALEE